MTCKSHHPGCPCQEDRFRHASPQGIRLYVDGRGMRVFRGGRLVDSLSLAEAAERWPEYRTALRAELGRAA